MIGDDFSEQVGEWCDKAGDRARVAFIAIAQDVLTRVKELTPVVTGNLRANWQAVRDGEEVAVMRQPTTTSIARGIIAGLSKDVQAAQLGEKIRILNPVIYARPIEYGRQVSDGGGGFTHRSGAAMVQKTLAELPKIADAAIKRVMDTPE